MLCQRDIFNFEIFLGKINMILVPEICWTIVESSDGL